MTSNIGTRQLKDFGQGIGFHTQRNEADNKQFTHGVIQKALNKTFAPEFLNRVDDIVIFDQLEKSSITKIVDIELNSVFERINQVGYKIKMTDAAKDFIATKGYDVQFGARPLKRAIQKYIEDELADIIIRREIKEGDVVEFDFDKEKDKINVVS
jgi:ATP-dependent Clp protease ATP-binding subunit ClpC